MCCVVMRCDVRKRGKERRTVDLEHERRLHDRVGLWLETERDLGLGMLQSIALHQAKHQQHIPNKMNGGKKGGREGGRDLFKKEMRRAVNRDR